LIRAVYLNIIEQLDSFVGKKDQFEVCLHKPKGRLISGIPELTIFQNHFKLVK